MLSSLETGLGHKFNKNEKSKFCPLELLSFTMRSNLELWISETLQLSTVKYSFISIHLLLHVMSIESRARPIIGFTGLFSPSIGIDIHRIGLIGIVMVKNLMISIGISRLSFSPRIWEFRRFRPTRWKICLFAWKSNMLDYKIILIM